MILAIDEFWKRTLLNEIRSPHPEQDFIPFVRFNSPGHGKLREKTSRTASDPSREGIVYGALQYLGFRIDLSRSRRTARLWKHVDVNKRIARIDRYPVPVLLDYQVSLYAEREERYLSRATMNLIRRLPESFYRAVEVDIFGDGDLTSKPVFFRSDDGNYGNILDHPKQYQVDITYVVEAWIFAHTSEDVATFWNRAEIEVCTLDRRTPIEPGATPQDTDTITIDL